MGAYIQILCRFQKYKQNVPPAALLKIEKSLFAPAKGIFFSSFGGTFHLHFWNLHKNLDIRIHRS